MLGYPDGLKQDAVAGIVAWYEQQGISIADGDVYFFGDRTETGLAFNLSSAINGICGQIIGFPNYGNLMFDILQQQPRRTSRPSAHQGSTLGRSHVLPVT